MMRNVYHWMARPRLQGFKKDRRIPDHGTEFDRWLREMNFNRREAAMALDLPEQRIRDLQAGWRNGRLNGGILPSIVTRLAMAAISAGVRPVPPDTECWDMVVRLAQAADNAGLAPWPPGKLLLKNPAEARRKGPLERKQTPAAKTKPKIGRPPKVKLTPKG